ncbi:MAG: ClbS/DfsB family four-helix bundle protein [Anaerolineales bacterium]
MLHSWQELLASLSEEQITEPLRPSTWTVKDVVAHLWAWQQASLARMAAALQGRGPVYPQWWQACGPDPEEDVNRTNAWIYQENRERTWSDVYTVWKDQFQQYIELTKIIPKKDLLEHAEYTWMGGYSLAASCLGSFEHHQEHYDTLLAWLKEHGT